MFKLQKVVKLVILLFGGMCLFSLFRNYTTNTPRSQDTNHPHTMLVILTYMRSGSSFTGDLIQRSPDVFYVFEPLWSVSRILKDALLKSTHLNQSASNHEYLSRNTMENFLTCNMKDIDLLTLGQYHMQESLTTRLYYKCISQKHGVFGIHDCLPLLERPCRQSRVSCVKTIRFTMKEMEYLMKKHSEMKVLHLLRDPRPTLLSQMSVGEFEVQDLYTSATKLCTAIETDLQDSAQLQSKYPGRIITLRYEDLAENPQNIVEQIYELLDIDLTDKIRKYVRNITTVTEENGDALSINRNSKASISKWRKTLAYEHAWTIDYICGNVYREMGYLPLKNKANLQNLTVRTYVDMPGKNHLHPQK